MHTPKIKQPNNQKYIPIRTSSSSQAYKSTQPLET